MWTTEDQPPKGMPFFPRPLALVSCKDNICTVGRMTLASTEPFRFMIGLSPASITGKYILETGEFAINFMTHEYLQELDYCGHIHGNEIDKFEETKLQRKKALKIKSDLVEEAFAIFECHVDKIEEYGDSFLIFGEVIAYHKKGFLSFPEDVKAVFSFANGFYASNKQPSKFQATGNLLHDSIESHIQHH